MWVRGKPTNRNPSRCGSRSRRIFERATFRDEYFGRNFEVVQDQLVTAYRGNWHPQTGIHVHAAESHEPSNLAETERLACEAIRLLGRA